MLSLCSRIMAVSSSSGRMAHRQPCPQATALRARAGPAEAQAPKRSLSVAIVGSGAAGLITAREFLRAGHRVTVLERGAAIGGVWRYSDEVEDDPLGQGARRVHGSMYAQLRTNLPREVMGLPDFPFDTHFEGSRDPRQFPGHEEVQRYLEAFAHRFGLLRLVRFGTEVQRLAPLQPGQGGAADASPHGWLRWEVTTRPAADPQQAAASSTTERYDAVVVANGHYSRPRLPRIPGQHCFPGLQLHSHNYRRPEAFGGQTVVLLGASSSGVDIAAEIASAGAKRVYLCARTWENPLTGEPLNKEDSSISCCGGSSSFIKAANLEELHADGSVTLADGSRIEGVDAIMYCTGYLYDFPFLEGTELVAVRDSRVAPLYQHVFPPAAAPTLSFVGLTWKVVPFPQFQLQGRWIAGVLSGTVALPPQKEMARQAAQFYESLDACGTPVRFTHRQSGDVQWQYNAWLAQQCGDQPESPWRQQMYAACGQSRKLNAGGYRDAPLPGAEAAERAAREEAARVRQRRAGAVAAASA